MLDPQKILTTVRRATELFRTTKGREGSVVTLAPEDVDDILVVGDLHGNVPTFRQVLGMAGLAKRPKRHLVLQELVHGPFFYPNDGGDRSHQLVDLVSALKCQHTDRVHLILGNHELSELTGRQIAKDGVGLNDLFRKGVQTAYGAAADSLIAAYHDLFRALPLAIRAPNRVMLCHTVPDGRDLDRLDLDVLKTGVWPPESMQRGGTVYALTWGRDTADETVDRFAALVEADLFITGHQPCDEGYQRANHRQLILDGTDPYPACCFFKANEPVTIDALLEGVRIIPPPSSE